MRAFVHLGLPEFRCSLWVLLLLATGCYSVGITSWTHTFLKCSNVCKFNNEKKINKFHWEHLGLDVIRDTTQLSPVLLSRRCSVSETMVEAAGFSTTGPQPQHMHCRAIPCSLLNSIIIIITNVGGKGGLDHMERRRLMPFKPWACCSKQ